MNLAVVSKTKIESKSMFTDRRGLDRRQNRRRVKVERRKSDRRKTGFNELPWWLACDYVEFHKQD